MAAPQTKSPRTWPAAWKVLDGGFQAVWVFVLWALGAVWDSVLAGLGLSSKASSPAAAAPPAMSRVFANPPKQLNENLYEIRSPQTQPNVLVIFFHGFELGDSKDAYWTDWLSADGSHCWLEALLGDSFPGARVLSVSYDASLHEGSNFGRADLHCIAETLLFSLTTCTGANVGESRCPVILVGHSLGGLVMKKVVLRAAESMSSWDDHSEVLEKFLRNIKGLFFYATPHSGSGIVATGRKAALKGAVVKDLQIWEKDSARLQEDFSMLQSRFHWRLYGLGELHETVLDGFRGVVVEQSSSMHGMANNHKAIPADHINICKPDRKESLSFSFLEDFIKGILHETVSHGHQCHGLPDYPVELEGRAEEVQELLMGVAVLGIFGMGGIGKTTLAKTVYNNISKEFEYSCFVDSVKAMQTNTLEDWLLNHFYRKGTKMGERQWSHLKDKKTLIVMDDIDSVDQLVLLPKLKHFGNDSRFIITSRDEGIFKFYDNCGLYEAKFLQGSEATKLFCRHAFNMEEIPSHLSSEADHLTKNVMAVVKKCNGLPLTVEVMGRYLRGYETDAEVWKETIDKLTNAQTISGERNDRVWASLRVSYDALAQEEQEMFIEAGTFFFQQPLKKALAAWSTTSGNAETRWKNLVRRSMVKEVSKTGREFGVVTERKEVWVHEQLRDLSWNLAKGNIVSGSGEAADLQVDLLNANEVDKKTKVLWLSDADQRILELDCIGTLKKLKYVDLDQVNHQGSACKIFPTMLSLLRWKNSERSMCRFPINLSRMKNLAVLQLENWEIPEDFPDALHNLTNLRTLSLSKLRGLDRLPDNFPNLSQLRQLDLVDLGLSRLPKSFGNLSALERLIIRGVDVVELPETFGDLLSLVSLTIVGCEKLGSLPESFGRRPTLLKELCIKGCPLLECLPQSFSQLSQLRRLYVEQCKSLKQLGDSFGNLSALEYLYIDDTSIENLPQSFFKLSRLQRLSLRNCRRMKELGDSFGNLSALRYVCLANVGIERLPESFGCLSALQELRLGQAIKLRIAHENIGPLTALKSITICGIDQLELPHSFGVLTSLLDLTIRSGSMTLLPESIGEIAGLQTLYLELKSVKALPLSIGQLSSLRSLNVYCNNLETLPANLGELARLEELFLKGDCVRALPTSLGNLSSLRTLQIHCPALEEIPDIFESLSQLEEFAITAKSLTSLPTSLGQLSSLGTLHLKCDNLRQIPFTFAGLSSLQQLLIVAPSLETLPTSIGEMSSLKAMCLYCDSLQELPVSLGKLSSLRTLLIDAPRLESLPDSVGQLQSLRTLKITGVSIKSLPTSIEQLQSLRYFVFDCDGHERLPDHFELVSLNPSLSLELKGDDRQNLPEGADMLSSLRYLTLIFPNLKSFPEKLGNLSSLQRLTVDGCSKLERLPGCMGRLSSLRVLDLISCSNLKTLPDCLQAAGCPPSPQAGGLQGKDESFQSAATTQANAALGLAVNVYRCPFLDSSVMKNLGWVEDIEKQYQRGRPSDETAPVEVRALQTELPTHVNDKVSTTYIRTTPRHVHVVLGTDDIRCDQSLSD